MADDAAYDLVLGQMMTSGGDAQNGIFMNWNDVPYVDFSKPWWTKSLRDATEINGKCYIAMSDMCISYTRQTWAIVFDKIETENRGINDVYESVENGTWTIDKLNSYTKDVYIDLNNDGISNEGDYFGYSTEIAGCPAVAYLYGFNQHIAVINGNKIDIVLNCEKAANIFEKLTALLENPGTFELSQHKLSSHFLTGNVMFTHLQIGTCYDKLRDYERDYGIIPFPKWDEAQEEYYSVVDAGCNVLCIPINIRDKELTGAIVEALSAESYKSVMPTFCDIALGVKTTRDEKSQEMLKLVLNNRYIDFAYIYDAWKGWVFKLQDLFGGKFASTYKQYEESTQNYYNSVLEFLNSDE